MDQPLEAGQQVKPTNLRKIKENAEGFDSQCPPSNSGRAEGLRS